MVWESSSEEKERTRTKSPASGALDLQVERAFVVHRDEVVAVGRALGGVLEEAGLGEQVHLHQRVVQLGAAATWLG